MADGVLVNARMNRAAATVGSIAASGTPAASEMTSLLWIDGAISRKTGKTIDGDYGPCSLAVIQKHIEDYERLAVS